MLNYESLSTEDTLNKQFPYICLSSVDHKLFIFIGNLAVFE